MSPKKVKTRQSKGWAGIVGTTIHKTKESDSKYQILAIYPSKRVAKLAYEKVVEVLITQVTKRKKLS